MKNFSCIPPPKNPRSRIDESTWHLKFQCFLKICLPRQVIDVKPVFVTDAMKENARANDGKCDPWGRFWYGILNFQNLFCSTTWEQWEHHFRFGTMGIEEPGKPGVLQRKQGSLYRLDERGGKKMADGIDISNGLTWDSDLK